jgi:WD40 repeat protein
MKKKLTRVYKSIEELSKALANVKLSPEEQTIFLSKVRIGPPLSTNPVSTLKGHSGSVNALAVLPDGQLASGSSDTSIKVWSGLYKASLTGHSEAVRTLVVLPDGRLASGGNDNNIKVWNLKSGRCEASLTGHSGFVKTLAVLPDGRLASGSRDGSIKVWDLKSRKCELTLTDDSGIINTLAVLPDGRLASGGNDKSIKLWDVKSGKCKFTLTDHSITLEVLPDGRLVSEGGSKSRKVLTKKSEKREVTLSDDSGFVNTLAVLPDGRLASGGNDKSIKLWDVKSGKCEVTLTGHSKVVETLAVLPDGRLASGSNDKSIKIWDVKSGTCKVTLTDHSGFFKTLAVLPDGRLASGSEDESIKIWNVGPRPMLGLTEVSEKKFHARVLLDLSTVNEKEFHAFVKCLKNTRITTLTFGKHLLSRLLEKPEPLEALIKSLTSSSLSIIDVSEDERLTIEHCKTLFKLLKDSSVMLKSPTQTWYKNGNLTALTKELEYLPLGYLDLSGCALDIDVVSRILKKSSKHLSHCILQYCNLTDTDIATLAPVLAECPQLRTLDIDHNQLGYAGAKNLLKTLFKKENSAINNLSVRHNKIEISTHVYLNELSDLLPISGTLQKLHLEGNSILSDKRHKNLFKVLQMLLVKSNLTVDQFLQTTFVSLNEGYELLLISPKNKPEKGKFYCEKQKTERGGFVLKYSVLDPKGEPQTDKITTEELKNWDPNKKLTKVLFNSILPDIFRITSKRGHTLNNADKNNYFFLTLKKSEKPDVILTLDQFEFSCFNNLKNEFEELKKLELESVFNFILQIGQSRLLIQRSLRNVLINDLAPPEQTKKIMKQLFDYHPSSPLKSALNRHPIFSSEPIMSTPSFLFPTEILTREEGRVYLLSVNGGQHLKMAYEYLTGYGQHYFKVAHLTLNPKDGKTMIGFDVHELSDICQHLLCDYTIAGFRAKTKNMKEMHDSIKNEENKNDIEYKKWIVDFKSSKQPETETEKTKRIENCVKWVTNKIYTHLGIKLDITLFKSSPHTLVQGLIDNPKSILGEKIDIINNLAYLKLIQEKQQQETKSCCIM